MFFNESLMCINSAISLNSLTLKLANVVGWCLIYKEEKNLLTSSCWKLPSGITLYGMTGGDGLRIQLLFFPSFPITIFIAFGFTNCEVWSASGDELFSYMSISFQRRPDEGWWWWHLISLFVCVVLHLLLTCCTGFKCSRGKFQNFFFFLITT